MSSHPASSRGDGRLPRAAPYALFALLVLVVYADPLLTNRNFAGRDPLAYHLPIEKAIHDAYARGRLPVWISEISGGRPLLANPNHGTLYPARPLLSLTPFPLAMRLFPLLHWIGAGVGMILLLRSLGASAGGAWIAAVTYVFSGVSVAEVFYPNIHPGMALLPWILWSARRLERPALERILAFSLFLALLLLAGDVFTISLGFLAALFWIALELPGGRSQARALGASAAAAVLAGLLAAPQWIASALWIPETNRAVLGMKLEEAFFFSISPWRLAELVVPFPFGETWRLDSSAIWAWPAFRGKAMGMFSTLFAGVFAIVALWTTRRDREPGLRFGRAFLLFALVLSVTPSLVPRAWGSAPSPLPLRYPEKFAVALILALAVIAGIGWDAFRKRAPAARWVLLVAALLAVAAVLVRAMPAPFGSLATSVVGADPALAARAGELLAAALAEAGLLWALTAIGLDRLRLGSGGAVAAALVLLTVVPVWANRRIARTFRADEMFPPTAFARRMIRDDPRGEYRTLGESPYSPPSRLEGDHAGSDVGTIELTRRNWHEYTHTLWGRGTIFNYDFDNGDLSRMESLRRISSIAARYTDASSFFGALSLRWGVRYRDQDPVPGFRPIGGDALRFWDEHENPYPDVRLLERWREEPGALTAVNVLPGLGPGEVVLESGRQARGESPAGTVRVRRKDPEHLVVETESPGPTWLFVVRAFWNHRTVRVDGREVTAIPAQLAFSAVPVPAGRHTVDWRERLPGSAVSRWGPVIYLLAAVGMLLGGRRRHPRRAGP